MPDNKIRKVKIIFTTDIHGNYFPHDFRRERWGRGSLQRVHAFVAQQCRRNTGSTILIDGGDILQGEPTAYYFNYIKQEGRHKVADLCNFIGYDVGVIGNHDIETGHKVFDRFVNDCNHPILGANVVNEETNEPYFEPYTILVRSGIRIAVMGFVTPAIPQWVPRNVWKGLRFEDIKTSAEKWVQHIKENEHPDFIIAVIHSGIDAGIVTPEYKENSTREVAEEVQGIDLILYGHDHTDNMEEIENRNGSSVLCVNPGSNAISVAEVNLTFTLDNEGKVVKHDKSCQLSYIGTLSNQSARDFQRHFSDDFAEVCTFANKKIGTFHNRINISDAYFGSSAYIDLIQHLQLRVSEADISFAAPLFFYAAIDAGEVKINNLFNLYRFEDKLYTLRLKGEEIKNYLEMSYATWTNRMTSADDNLLLTSPMKNNPERLGFTNFLFNFDSAMGIRYEVDVTKPEGEKVRIFGMTDGRPFSMDAYYKVAMTAYRTNGGGELLTKGAGLSKEEIERRIISHTERDIRHYLMKYIEEKQDIYPQADNHWRFVPEEWTTAAVERERQLLFGNHPSTINH